MKPITFILALVALTLAACSGSKSMAKKGMKLEAGGLYAEAADMYLQSLIRNRNNVEARIGLKKTGQLLLNDKLGAFFRSFAAGDSKEEAVNAYLSAKSYADRAGQYGVVLDIPSNYTTDFNDVKGRYLVEQYQRGQELLAAKDYKGAEAVFAKITALDPAFKDSGTLKNVAYLEPLYQSGKDALAQGHYRKAYADLDKVTSKDAAYKDATALKDEAVTKGRYAIAVLPFSGARKSEAARAQALVMTALTGMADPFIKVVDRENMERILEEQRLSMSGVIDEATAVQAGKLIGAQAVVMGTLVDYREETGMVKKGTRDGFRRYEQRVKDINNPGQMVSVVRFAPVKYTEYQQENKATASFSYKLVSLETGEVLVSKLVDRTVTDQARYAGYDGQPGELYPSRNGVVFNDGYRDLQNQLRASRTVKAPGVLGSDALRQVTEGVAWEVQGAIANRIP
ncbi:MAG: hypothetical protein JST41_14385 [Bacteroidetes bacterium]|nr:hypothetical protein [Bacteroidota bacterium]MCC6653917.1 hypothetical protein [Flavobacteriales bacterium]HMU13899.1 CsgG/HfaB family protein [Flavobacteriales bacterium]